jgi:hypothetical protein
MKMSKVSRQKVSAAMRKAGLQAAKWNASAMVRGWGDWSSGVRVQEIGGEVHVYWQTGRWSSTQKADEINLPKIAAALEAAGIEFEQRRDEFIVTGLAGNA